MGLLEKTIGGIGPADARIAEEAKKRQDDLTKPRGSLGLLEETAVRVAAMQGSLRPRLGQGVVFVMAADHGVAREGVSLYPQEVTAQMVANFLSGGAAINVLSKAAGARVVVTDCGVASGLPPPSAKPGSPRLYDKKVAQGTMDMAQGPAMTPEQARRSLEVGIEVFEAEYALAPFDMAATGDMGIANTTSSSAITAALTGLSVAEVVGRGTGLDDEGLRRKAEVVARALALNAPDPANALDLLAKVGGFEIGAIAGVCLAAAARRMPVLVDGFISTAGAALAWRLAPSSVDYMVAAHLSVERGHRALLDAMGLKPLLDLGLRLGEGTGAALAMPLCVSACRILDEMATFSEAGVSDKE
jgi:nicotinate-nucleotide--dimethylbenzimidazole phosphoribosyltransferase